MININHLLHNTRSYRKIRLIANQFLKCNKHLNNFSSVSLDASNNNQSQACNGKVRFHIETYGCQMNVSDSEIVRSILVEAGYEHTTDMGSANILLTNTCAIRDQAEAKIWGRLDQLQNIRKKNRLLKNTNKSLHGTNNPIVGVLGCMAERLKEKLLEKPSVDFICGPDAYRDIPRLIEGVLSTGQKEANTQLSLEETYADIQPIRETSTGSAFISIMRGCNNMCSFCIVPFTRGRERSRPIQSIVSEIISLNQHSNIKEIVLLGQNVNGYHDTSQESIDSYPSTSYESTTGFSNLFNSKKRDLPGARFPDLLQAVAEIDPEMRIRFTSPHPKDFPDKVLDLIGLHPNICPSLHLPVQSGSTSVLERMRRGYTREAYIELVSRVREKIPNVTISTDIITGFCDESEDEHQETLSLMQQIEYDQAFMFAYSLRQKTHAAHTMEDNVSNEVKQHRLQEIIDLFRSTVRQKNLRQQYGQLRLVLVEGRSTKSTEDQPSLTGRTDGNHRVVFPAGKVVQLSTEEILSETIHAKEVDCAVVRSFVNQLMFGDIDESDWKKDHLQQSGMNQLYFNSHSRHLATDDNSIFDPSNHKRYPLVNAVDCIGKYVLVRILKADTTTLRGVAVTPWTLQAYHAHSSSLSFHPSKP